MPQLEQIATFPSQIFWLIVTFTALFLVMWRIAVPRIADVLEARQKRIDDNLDKAETAKKEAEAAIEAYEASLADARDKAHGLINDTAAQIAADSAEKDAELTEQLHARIVESEKAIANAREKALASIRDTAVEVAIAATEKLIGDAPDRAAVEKAVDGAMKS
ncbi:MAG: F0F1 ATP synthase subunit B' [Rhodospirillales bacterium]